MKKNIISLILNSIIVIFTIISVIMMLTGKYSFTGIKFFTVDSNILMGIVALIMCAFNMLSIKKKTIYRKKWMSHLKIMGTSAVGVTFITVFAFLIPTQGNLEAMLLGSNLFMHVLTPLLSFITFLFFDENIRLSKAEALSSIAPSFIYSIVYLACVLSGAWKDFYGFTFGGKYYLSPIVMLVIWGLSYGLAVVFSILERKINPDFKK